MQLRCLNCQSVSLLGQANKKISKPLTQKVLITTAADSILIFFFREILFSLKNDNKN